MNDGRKVYLSHVPVPPEHIVSSLRKKLCDLQPSPAEIDVTNLMNFQTLDMCDSNRKLLDPKT